MREVVLLKGDGIGPEITAAVVEVLDAAGAPVEWRQEIAGEEAIEKEGTPLPPSTLDAIRETGVALKGPLTTPIGKGFRSISVALRKEMELYVNLRPARTYKGVKSRYDDIDIVVVRENMEDLYAGIEHAIGDYAAESIKLLTRPGCERIVRYAFEYAVKENRKKVTAVHKANIMKLTDGLFLNVAKDIAVEYPQIEFEDRIVDNMCMQLVQKPELYDVLVMPNLYGDIVSDLCAGLVGGLGVTPGANIGDKAAIFEPVHGSAPKYAGQNRANPTAMLLSAVMMLRYLQADKIADSIERALAEVIAEGRTVTPDLGGNSGTREMAAAIIKKLK